MYLKHCNAALHSGTPVGTSRWLVGPLSGLDSANTAGRDALPQRLPGLAVAYCLYQAEREYIGTQQEKTARNVWCVVYRRNRVHDSLFALALLVTRHSCSLIGLLYTIVS
eukprot:1388751-Amorphochlora_amoeboformis.AAC.1